MFTNRISNSELAKSKHEPITATWVVGIGRISVKQNRDR